MRKIKDLIFRKVYNELLSNENRKAAHKKLQSGNATRESEYEPEPTASPSKPATGGNKNENLGTLTEGNLPKGDKRTGRKLKTARFQGDDDSVNLAYYEVQCLSPEKGTPHVEYPGKDSGKHKSRGAGAMSSATRTTSESQP